MNTARKILNVIFRIIVFATFGVASVVLYNFVVFYYHLGMYASDYDFTSFYSFSFSSYFTRAVNALHTAGELFYVMAGLTVACVIFSIVCVKCTSVASSIVRTIFMCIMGVIDCCCVIGVQRMNSVVDYFNGKISYSKAYAIVSDMDEEEFAAWIIILSAAALVTAFVYLIFTITSIVSLAKGPVNKAQQIDPQFGYNPNMQYGNPNMQYNNANMQYNNPNTYMYGGQNPYANPNMNNNQGGFANSGTNNSQGMYSNPNAYAGNMYNNYNQTPVYTQQPQAVQPDFNAQNMTAQEPIQPEFNAQEPPVQEPIQPEFNAQEPPVQEPIQPEFNAQETPVQEPVQPDFSAQEAPVQEPAQPEFNVQETPVQEPVQPEFNVQETPVQEQVQPEFNAQATPTQEAPQNYGAPQGYTAPQSYGAPQGYTAPQNYGVPQQPQIIGYDPYTGQPIYNNGNNR